MRRVKNRHRSRPRSRKERKRVQSRRRAVQCDCDGSSLRRAILASDIRPVTERPRMRPWLLRLTTDNCEQIGRQRLARAASASRRAQPIVLYKGIGFDRSPPPRRSAGRAARLRRPGLLPMAVGERSQGGCRMPKRGTTGTFNHQQALLRAAGEHWQAAKGGSRRFSAAHSLSRADRCGALARQG